MQRNRSFLVGKKGARIASAALTLVDDPLIAGGLSSNLSDDDGFPHARVTLVQEGVLQSYLHNHYTARKSGETNTGHSTRNGIACTNLCPALGAKTAQELIAEVEEGLYVALAQPRPDTGLRTALRTRGRGLCHRARPAEPSREEHNDRGTRARIAAAPGRDLLRLPRRAGPRTPDPPRGRRAGGERGGLGRRLLARLTQMSCQLRRVKGENFRLAAKEHSSKSGQ